MLIRQISHATGGGEKRHAFSFGLLKKILKKIETINLSVRVHLMQWHLVVYLQTRAGLTESVVCVCVFTNQYASTHAQTIFNKGTRFILSSP